MAQSNKVIVAPSNSTPSGFISTDLQDWPLKGSDAAAWSTFVQGCRNAGTTCADGAVIKDTKTALRWLIEQLRATDADPQLVTVINAWNGLSAPTKASILALL